MASRTEALVSIVIINCNYAAYLQEAAHSALTQTYKSVEVIVVDDGSTDASRAMIRAMQPHVRPVFQNQAGHVAAFNAGYAAAAGDVILFLDADDWLDAECICEVMRAWTPMLAKVQFRLRTVDADGVDQNMPFPYFAPDLTPQAVLRQSLSTGFYPWTVSTGNAYSREYLKKVMPIPEDRIFKSPDGYVNKLAPLYGEICTVDRILGNYRVHGKNAWAQSGAALNVDGIIRAVRFDALLHREFAERAAEAGYRVEPYESTAVPQMLEVRLLSLRLSPAQHPIDGDRRLQLVRLGLRASWRAANISAVGRVAWMFWFITLGFVPMTFVRRLFMAARGQTRRSTISRFVIQAARGSAGLPGTVPGGLDHHG